MFGRQFTLFRISGIKIGVDFSWFFIAILMSWTLAVGYFPYNSPNLTSSTYWTMGVAGMLGLFVCVLLHELGHTFVARYYNLPIAQITLFFFGGVAEIKKDPPSPKIEFLVSIAGPIVSVFLAIFMYLLSRIGGGYGWPIQVIGVTEYLCLINTVIVIFNLIPAIPLDGGRILRAILWQWKKDLRYATRVTTRLGMMFGFTLIILGLFLFMTRNFIDGLWLMLIGFFLRFAAMASRTQFYVTKELRGEKVSKFMVLNPITVGPDATIKQFIDDYVYQSHHHLYPVIENDTTLLGYISLKEVKALKAELWADTRVKDVMIPREKFLTILPGMHALDALNLIQQTQSATLLVTDDAHLVGMLTAQDLFKIISIKLEVEEGIDA